MTKRIALFILATVWAILIAVGIGAYFTTCAVLLAGLDQSLVDRAASVPDIVDDSGRRYASPSPLRSDDRYLVRNDIGQTMSRPGAAANAQLPTLLDAAFVKMPDGSNYRRVTVRAFATPANGGAVAPVKVSFSGSAADFDSLMRRLAWTLGVIGLAGGALAAIVAWRVAKSALRPLHATAEVIGEIDDRALNRRIDMTHLPPELIPVGARLNEMLARLEDAFGRRKQFLADAAHELRTPVAAMITGLEVTLRRPREASGYCEAMQTCLDDARWLRKLVESLMNQARAELRELAEPVEVFDLAEFIDQLAASMRPLAEGKSVRLEATTSQSPLPIRSVPGRLRGVLMNLVGNAIAYNRAGGEVAISAAAEAQDVRITIRDTGVGIAAEHLPHLFEPFYRVDKVRAIGEGHLGLGLFLVKTHIESMNGTCGVSSELGKGTTFVVTLRQAVDRPGKPRINAMERVAT